MNTVRTAACERPSSLSFRAITLFPSHNATEQTPVAVSIHKIITKKEKSGSYFSLKRSSFLTISTRELSESFLLIALKGADITLALSLIPEIISI